MVWGNMTDGSATLPRERWSSFLATRTGLVVLGLLAIELMAAMQVFTTATILPTVAADLDGQQWYGVVNAAGTVSVLLTLPLGGRLLARFGASPVLGYLAPVYVLGGVLSALAPTMLMFAAGRAVQGLSAGAMATVALGTVAASVPAPWRPRVLAMTSAMWVLPALLGPSLAGLIASTVGWRWSMVSLLPLLLAVRWTLAALLAKDTGKEDGRGGPFALHWAILLAACICVVVLASTGSRVALAISVCGVVGALVAAQRLLPPGVGAGRRGRPAAVGGMFLLSLAYFGIDYIIAILASDATSGSIAAAGAVLTVGALCWAFSSMAFERVTGRSTSAAERTGGLGPILIVVGLLLVAIATTAWNNVSLGTVALYVGWSVASIGMGVAYPSLLNAILSDAPDGITPAGAANAAVLTEAIGAALGGSIAGTALSLYHAQSDEWVLAALLGVFIVAALLVIPLLRRASSATDGH
jgi:MFS family permease